MTSLFDDRLKDEIISLQIGAPGPDLLESARQVFKKSVSESTLNENVSEDLQLFQYGPAAGSDSFVQSCAQFLSHQYGDQVDPDRLLLTCGATHGLHLLATSLLDLKRGVVFVEDPTYFLALDILQKDLSLKIVPVPGILGEGQALEKVIQQEKFANTNEKFWGMVYAIPHFQNPTGRQMTSDQCKNLIEVTKRHNLLLVCDDVYNLLWYDGSKSTSRLLQFGKNESHVVSNASFSKILSPGIRVGWIEAHLSTISRLSSGGVLTSGGAVNNVMSGIIAQALSKGYLLNHLEKMRQTLGIRMKAACDILEAELPQGFTFERPQGGYFVWISGPSNFDSTKFCDQNLSSMKVAVLAGERASGDRQKPQRNSLRISIAYFQTDLITEGCKRICTALLSFQM